MARGIYSSCPAHDIGKLWVRVTGKSGAVAEGLIENSLESFHAGDVVMELIEPRRWKKLRRRVRIERSRIAKYVVLGVCGARKIGGKP